jgi:hypothetical protein
MLWNLLNTILAVSAIAIAIWGTLYNKKQFRLSERQDQEAKTQALEDAYWAEKFGRAATVLVSVSGKMISTPQYGYGYHLLFKPELRQRIEALLVELDPSNIKIQVRSLSSDHLRRQDVREAITDLLTAVELARCESPEMLKVLDIT